MSALYRVRTRLFMCFAALAVLGTLALAPAAGAKSTGGTYLAPRFNQWGKPRVTGLRKKARDPVAARRLWELSAELTGCDWR